MRLIRSGKQIKLFAIIRHDLYLSDLEFPIKIISIVQSQEAAEEAVERLNAMEDARSADSRKFEVKYSWQMTKMGASVFNELKLQQLIK